VPKIENVRPRARRTNIMSRKIGDELIVYDHDRHVATSLNAFSVEVWERCDGHTPPSAIAEALSRREGAGAADERAVWLAVDKLNRAKLFEEHVDLPPSVLGGSSRRAVLRRLGIGAAAAAAVPVVISITAPTPAAAATCLPASAPCTTNAQCCSGQCHQISLPPDFPSFCF